MAQPLVLFGKKLHTQLKIQYALAKMFNEYAKAFLNQIRKNGSCQSEYLTSICKSACRIPYLLDTQHVNNKKYKFSIRQNSKCID